MIISFVATTTSRRDALQELVNGEGHHVFHDDGWSYLFRGTEPLDLDEHHFSADGQRLFLVGELLNIPELRQILAIYDSSALTLNPAGVVWLLYRHLGRKGMSLLDGSYTVLLRDDRGKLHIISDPLGLMPVNIVRSEHLWATSELKSLVPLPDVKFEFADRHEVARSAAHGDDYTPIRNVRRAKPGEVFSLGRDGMGHHVVESAIWARFGLTEPQHLSSADARDLIHRLLTSAVSNCIAEPRIALPLSGGLDSSTVCAIAARQRKDLTTLSIGTEQSDEFQYSRIVAARIGSQHREILLTEQQILDGMVEAVYYNEIFDGLSAEIQSPLLVMYGLCKGEFDALVTGYGADLLFGGVLQPGTSAESVNRLLWEQVYRTRWTGEFSPFGAANHGLKVRHPFWNIRLLSFCLNLWPELKVSTKEIKVVLREYAAQHAYFPDEITWRKKIGIHEGSSVNSIFARYLGGSVRDYERKTLFTYSLYREFLGNGKTPEHVDLDALRGSLEL